MGHGVYLVQLVVLVLGPHYGPSIQAQAVADGELDEGRTSRGQGIKTQLAGEFP